MCSRRHEAVGEKSEVEGAIDTQCIVLSDRSIRPAIQESEMRFSSPAIARRATFFGFRVSLSECLARFFGKRTKNFEKIFPGLQERHEKVRAADVRA